MTTLDNEIEVTVVRKATTSEIEHIQTIECSNFACRFRIFYTQSIPTGCNIHAAVNEEEYPIIKYDSGSIDIQYHWDYKDKLTFILWFTCDDEKGAKSKPYTVDTLNQICAYIDNDQYMCAEVCFWYNNSCNSTPRELTETPNRMKEWKRFPPGVGVGDTHTPIQGTFGCVVRKDNKRMLLSCRHVIVPHTGIGDTKVFQGGIDNIIGEVKLFTEYKEQPGTNYVDCAIAEVYNEANMLTEILDGNGYPTIIPTGTTEPYIGQKVIKSGAKTGLVTGEVLYIDESATMYAGGVPYNFEDVIITTLISKDGDSGSLLLEEGTNKAVGLVFGADHDKRYTFACNISKVLSAMGCTLDTLPTQELFGLVCPWCGLKCDNIYDLYEHVENHHTPCINTYPEWSMYVPYCIYCGINFTEGTEEERMAAYYAHDLRFPTLHTQKEVIDAMILSGDNSELPICWLDPPSAPGYVNVIPTGYYIYIDRQHAGTSPRTVFCGPNREHEIRLIDTSNIILLDETFTVGEGETIDIGKGLPDIILDTPPPAPLPPGTCRVVIPTAGYTATVEGNSYTSPLEFFIPIKAETPEPYNFASSVVKLAWDNSVIKGTLELFEIPDSQVWTVDIRKTIPALIEQIYNFIPSEDGVTLVMKPTATETRGKEAKFLRYLDPTTGEETVEVHPYQMITPKETTPVLTAIVNTGNEPIAVDIWEVFGDIELPPHRTPVIPVGETIDFDYMTTWPDLPLGQYKCTFYIGQHDKGIIYDEFHEPAIIIVDHCIWPKVTDITTPPHVYPGQAYHGELCIDTGGIVGADSAFADLWVCKDNDKTWDIMSANDWYVCDRHLWPLLEETRIGITRTDVLYPNTHYCLDFRFTIPKDWVPGMYKLRLYFGEWDEYYKYNDFPDGGLFTVEVTAEPEVNGTIDIPASDIPTTLYQQTPSRFAMMIINTGTSSAEYQIAITFEGIDTPNEEVFWSNWSRDIAPSESIMLPVSIELSEEAIPIGAETAEYNILTRLVAR